MVNEIGSGVSDRRPNCLNGLAGPTFEIVVVEHQERASSLEFRFLETLLESQHRHNQDDTSRLSTAPTRGRGGGEEVVADLVALVSSLCARLFGQRRAKRTSRSKSENRRG